MIIVDYNAIAIGGVVGSKMGLDENFIRHTILNSLRMYKKKFKDYGEMVIVSDAGGNWRKDVFPEYKAKRKSSREDSKIDWEEVFRITHMVREEITENFHWRVIHQWGCEADDVIATLCQQTQEFGNYEPVMIVSADHDFKQLQVYDNVKQYSPLQKKFVVAEPSATEYRLEHIIKGCSGDGVPNVLSDDDTFIDESKRQTPMSKKKLQMLMENPRSLGEQVYRNYIRNEKLVSLTDKKHDLPESVRSEIINTFEEQKDRWHNKGKIFPYLVQKRCRLLLESVEEFF